ncbi:MAG TPA: hypothetical protein VK568_10745 [Thermodesulfobacteriota bacterium]|jgi:nicotinic acid phosphoribosyltransferase|nr:hypothetical protein [Thermodesulfobacteriota bacterium]
MEPTNKLVNPMMTDFYQITMSYAYFDSFSHIPAATTSAPFGNSIS